MKINNSKKPLTQFLSIFLAFAFLNLIVSCSTFKVVEIKNYNETQINSMYNNNRYFIVHETDTAWHLDEVHTNKDFIFGDKQILPEWHKTYKMPLKVKDNQFDRKDSLGKQVVNELHLYTNHIIYIDSVRVAIPFDSIAYYQQYRQQNKAVLPIVLGATGLIFITIIIVAIANAEPMEPAHI